MTLAPPKDGEMSRPSNSTSSVKAGTFDVHSAYNSHLTSSSDVPMPIAAMLSLCDLISSTPVQTTTELTTLLKTASEELKAALPNPVPATAGLDLFTRLVGAMAWGDREFEEMKRDLIAVAREYAGKTVPLCRDVIAKRALPFIKDDAIILTHSYSRVVMHILLTAAKAGRRPNVYVTEARPMGLGLKTHAELEEAGVPCTVVCDAAAAYIMSKVDLVLVGAEGVCESGGLLNAVGTLQLALIAKASDRPCYAAAESFKFLRVFPLSQHDVPTSRRHILALTPPREPSAGAKRSESGRIGSAHSEHRMTQAMEDLNPLVDYTPPHLLAALFSDVGVLATSSGVGDALLSVYGGAD